MRMKSLAFVVATLCVPATFAAPQSANKPPAQLDCQKEVGAWFAPTDLLAGDGHQILSFAELLHRRDTMTACFNAYPKSAEAELYADEVQSYEQLMGRRAINFIRRHDMGQQFLSEDAEGKRD